jgi:hypothetical protein
MMVARFVTGIGTGIETSTVPMYQAELCEASKRGKLVCSEPLLVGVGIVIRYDSSNLWCRWPALTAAATFSIME